MIARSTREDPEGEAREIAASPLRLGSIADFGEVPLLVLDAVAPRRIVEVGGAGGAFARVLLDWARPRGAEVVCVDPAPSPALAALSADGLRLIRGTSPGALASAGGDHNHAVVSAELALVQEGACVLLHDVGWPLGRRDAYHAPERLAPHEVHPHSFTGHVTPHGPDLRESGGLAGEPPLGLALRPGGERNGVLTAVEDFMAGRPELELLVIPCIYGLGALFPSAAPYAGGLREALGPYADSPLLAKLEANRLALLYRLLEGGRLR